MSLANATPAIICGLGAAGHEIETRRSMSHEPREQRSEGVLSSGALVLVTLGKAPRLVSVSATGEEESLLAAGKPLALAIYLCLQADRSAHRETLVDLLWGDSPVERGRLSLRQVLWQIRRRCGAGVIRGDADSVTWCAQVTVDYTEVDRALAEGRVDNAAERYPGDFLPTFGVPGGVRFEHWADQMRTRLRGRWLGGLSLRVRGALDAGKAGEAVVMARKVREADPTSQVAWRLLIDSLVAANDIGAARLEADGLERLFANEGEDLDAESVAQVRRVRAMVVPSALSGHGPLVAELTGREREFRGLVGAWQSVLNGQPQHVHLRAPAGLGKTRLLRDLERRLRAVGGGFVLYVRSAPGERQIPYTWAAALSRMLMALPGALGVSPSALQTIATLDPTIGLPPGITPDRTDKVDVPRRRTLALSDLLQSVTEEAPLALLLDDVHWMDGESFQVLTGLLARITGQPVLVVTAGRPFGEEGRLAADAPVMRLAPLTIEELEQLLSSLAPLPSSDWVGTLLTQLHETTGGSPHLVLESLRLALDRGVLGIGDMGWSCAAPDAVGLLAEGGALTIRVGELGADAQRLMSLLAVAGGSLSRGALVRGGRVPADRMEHLLGVLDAGGFVFSADGRWHLTHDEMTRVLLERLSTEERQALERDAGLGLATAEDATPFDFRQAVRLLISGGAEESLGSVYVRWLHAAHQLQDHRTDLELAHDLLGGLATRSRLRMVLRSRDLPRRLGLGTHARRWAAGLVVMMLVTGLIAWDTRSGFLPASLALVQPPLAGNDKGLVPIPVVEIRDRSGRRVRKGGEFVTVEMEGDPNGLVGTTVAKLVEGHATFDRVTFRDGTRSGQTLLFMANGLPFLRHTLRPMEAAALHLERGMLNGQILAPDSPLVILRPGEQVRGELFLRYDAFWAAASVILVAVPTWGDKQSSFVTLAGVATPTTGAGLRQSVVIEGPRAPGEYHLLLAFAAEPDGRWIASGTNWKVGEPIWGDGNDLADLPRDSIAAGSARGSLRPQWTSENGRVPAVLAITSIVVRVEPESSGELRPNGERATPRGR